MAAASATSNHLDEADQLTRPVFVFSADLFFAETGQMQLLIQSRR